MYLKISAFLFLFLPLGVVAQYPFASNDYIRQNTNIVTGNDLIYPGDFDSFKGKIKSVTQQEYAATRDTAGVVQRREFMDSHASFTYFFDKEKKITEAWDYASNQVIISKKHFRDFKNNQIDSAKTWTKSGKLISSEKWEYDAKNFPQVKRVTMMKETRDFPFTTASEGEKVVLYLGDYKNVYRYGVLIARTFIPGKKDFQYVYHNNGVLKTKRESEMDHITKNTTFDENGNVISNVMNEYAKDGSLISTTDETNTWDAKGFLTESIISVNAADSSAIKKHELYEYENKKLKYIYAMEKGEKRIFATYRYNKEGDLIAIESEKSKFTYEYTGYDKQLNWTRAVVLRDGDPLYIWERTIQYY